MALAAAAITRMGSMSPSRVISVMERE